MAQITRQQIQKINEKCKNNWELDLYYFLCHSEKTLQKIIEIDSENYLKFKLDYNYKNQICLHISKYHHKENEDFAISQGMGKQRLLDETQYSRRSISNIIEYTKILDNDELMKINSQTDVIRNGIVIPSEVF